MLSFRFLFAALNLHFLKKSMQSTSKLLIIAKKETILTANVGKGGLNNNKIYLRSIFEYTTKLNT